MKRALLYIPLLVLSCATQAQFAPNTVLTAAALNSALASPNITGGSINGTTSILTSGAVTLNGVNTFGANTTAVTPSYLANSTAVATSQYVRQAILASSATVPITVIGGGGTYNFASAGSGLILGVTISSGAITSVTGVVSGGAGYNIGDCLAMAGGNGDAIVYVNSVSSGSVTSATVMYGGTNYSGTPQLAGLALTPGSRTGLISGTLTSNATIIVPAGTYLAGGRRFGFANNTTGAYTVTVKLSNGAGGYTGTGVVLPQGTANNTSMLLYTDGVTDVWPETVAAPDFAVANTLTVGGVPVKGRYVGTTGSLGGSLLSAGACSTTTLAVNGATNAMIVNVTPVADPGGQFFWKGYVSSANTVTAAICNGGSIGTPVATTYNVRVSP